MKCSLIFTKLKTNLRTVILILASLKTEILQDTDNFIRKLNVKSHLVQLGVDGRIMVY
jgi:hypothetical protein